MTYLQALKQVRERLVGGSSVRFICDNLKAIGASEYRLRVQTQLFGHYTYEGWLEAKHPDIFEEMLRANSKLEWGQDLAFLDTSASAFQQGRIQWLDHMIKEESK